MGNLKHINQGKIENIIKCRASEVIVLVWNIPPEVSMSMAINSKCISSGWRTEDFPWDTVDDLF